MENKQNLHTHTTYADGKDTPEEIILKAIEKGFDSIGFSEHSFMASSSFPCQMTVKDMENYKKEIRFLKSKYKGLIDVFCGMELEMYSDVPTDGIDYLIGSVHYLDFNGNLISFDRGLNETLDYVNDNFGGDGLSFAKKYFETLACLPEKGNIDIIGHFDICAKNNEKGDFFDTTSKEYLNLGYESIHNLKGKIPLFEVNTGAMARGYRTIPYPQIEFLKEFKDCGFGAVISSDCHNKDFIDCYFDEARELLISVGFKSRFILTDKGFKEVSI